MCNKNINSSDFEEIIRQTIKDYTLFDDAFMSAVFDGNIELTQYVLRVILERDDLTVSSVKSQYELSNLFGRRARLDVLARDKEGNRYDIEVQRAREQDIFQRVRYYQSLMDSESLKEGHDFQEITKSYIIFLLDYDLYGDGFPVYHVDRKIRENGRNYEDGREILYVNGTYRNAGDAIGELMHDFSCSDYRMIQSEVIRNTVRDCKDLDSREGKRMSELAERILKDHIESYKVEIEKAEQKVKNAEQALLMSENKVQILENLLQRLGIDYSEELKKAEEAQ